MYKYKLLNNHYVVEIDNRHYIIDTGYPYSVTFRNDLNVVKVNNHFYSLMPSGYDFDIQKTHNLVGFPVDGLLGNNVFGESGLTFYKDNNNEGRVDFTAHDIDGTTCPIIGMMIAPIIRVNNNKNFLVDTGARYAYGQRNVFIGLAPFDEVDDYNPRLKVIHAPIYHTEITLNEKRCPLDVCYHPKVASNIPGIYIVGNITTLFDKECSINFKQRKIIFN